MPRSCPGGGWAQLELTDALCYIELYEAQHPPVQMDKNIRCELTFCDQYCLCYIELYEAQHPPVQMHKNIKCDLNSVISTVYVTLNCMRRNTRQFRWIKILGAILHFVISSCLCHIELYKAQHPPVQMDKKIKCDLNSVISIVYVTLNCMRRNTRQFR